MIKNALGCSVLIIALLFFGCSANKQMSNKKELPIIGTWQLLTGTLIEKKDTVITQYTKGVRFIKIINPTHFSFIQHDLTKGKNADSTYVSGGGKYMLRGNVYTEHLEFCSSREWEGNDFTFTVLINNDTLIQKGIEKVESKGINRLNIEKYVRVKE